MSKLNKAYYSTTEVSKLLGISRTTVQRYLDKGKLDGRKNKITGWRRISYASIVKLANEVGLVLK